MCFLLCSQKLVLCLSFSLSLYIYIYICHSVCLCVQFLYVFQFQFGPWKRLQNGKLSLILFFLVLCLFVFVFIRFRTNLWCVVRLVWSLFSLCSIPFRFVPARLSLVDVACPVFFMELRAYACHSCFAISVYRIFVSLSLSISYRLYN